MSRTICLRCRASRRQSLRAQHLYLPSSFRQYSSSTQPIEPIEFLTKDAATPQPRPSQPKTSRPSKSQKLDITALLSKPTWSVRSLAPPPPSSTTQEITPTQLHHLLRLSALPQPSSPEHEAKLLETLHAQLHFVRDVQSVDTEGVEPMYCVRDETEVGEKECTVGLDDVKEALGREETRGRMRRVRRKRGEGEVLENKVEEWNVFGAAGEVVQRGESKYFVVRSGKE